MDEKKWKNDSITEAQFEYIEILSDYPATKKEDGEDIQHFLKKVGKNL